ncbi:MAG: 16S rRNA (guanine(527)-N(7))-methyltransferase RsmG [Ktedonobacterales bacterium]
MATGDGDLTALADGARALGITLDDAGLATFARYRELLLEWNARINLTAITDPHEILTRHFLDSLSCLLAVPPQQRLVRVSLLDIGSGAGFPGLVLAIACPAWQVTLLEATGKKVRFLDAAIEVLHVANASTLHGRAEEVAHLPQYRGAYDIATARAVATLPTLLEYCAPLVRPGGLILLPKKGDIAEELAAGKRAASQLGLLVEGALPVPAVAGLEDNRSIVTAVQVRPAPARYPRPAGVPAKHPLH